MIGSTGDRCNKPAKSRSIFGFAPIVTIVIYVLVGLSALYQIMPLTKQLQGGMA